MAEELLGHSEIKHGPISICFTPDEEVGQGADFFDIPFFAIHTRTKSRQNINSPNKSGEIARKLYCFFAH